MFSSFVFDGAEFSDLARILLACLISIGMGMRTPVYAQQAHIPYWGSYVAAPHSAVISAPHYPHLLPYGYGFLPPPPYPYPYPYYFPYLPPNAQNESNFDVSKVIPAGRLFIKIQPEDAEVMVDGFQLSPAANNAYEIGLLVGPHKIEARKQNYGSYSGVVEVRRNEGLLVTISLTKTK